MNGFPVLQQQFNSKYNLIKFNFYLSNISKKLILSLIKSIYRTFSSIHVNYKCNFFQDECIIYLSHKSVRSYLLFEKSILLLLSERSKSEKAAYCMIPTV